MKRRRGDEDAKTHPHARALEPRGEGSADAIFRSFVQRAGGVPEVPADTGTSPDETPADGTPLDDLEPLPPPSDATDPRIPARWAETVEMLLDPRTDLNRPGDLGAPSAPAEVPTALAPAEPATVLAAPEPATVLAPPEASTVISPTARMTPADGVLLLTARKTAPPSTAAPTDLDDDDARTVSVQSARLAEQVRAAGPPPRAERPRTDEREPTAIPDRSRSGRIRAPIETPSEPIELRAPSKRPSARPPPEPVPTTSAEPWESVVRAPSETTQRREALRLVPDVAQVAVAKPPPGERSEDGLIPSGVLDRKLSDMAVLLRYGHEVQVRRELDQLRTRYSQDLLLARRIAEFYVANERPALALEQLFSLATGLFERRNVEGMKQALEQVLVIEPRNERASRLLGLLEQRPTDPPPAPGQKRR